MSKPKRYCQYVEVDPVSLGAKPCVKPHYAHGFCQAHYRRLVYLKRPEGHAAHEKARQKYAQTEQGKQKHREQAMRYFDKHLRVKK